MLDDGVFAADHHAVAAFEAPDAAAGSDVDVVNALGEDFLGSADVVDVIGVAAVDEDVSRLKERNVLGECGVYVSGGDHEPDGARRGQLADEVFGGGSSGDSLLFREVSDGLRGVIVDNAFVAVSNETANHVRSHTAETYHSKLHWHLLYEGRAQRNSLRHNCWAPL